MGVCPACIFYWMRWADDLLKTVIADAESAALQELLWEIQWQSLSPLSRV